MTSVLQLGGENAVCKTYKPHTEGSLVTTRGSQTVRALTTLHLFILEQKCLNKQIRSNWVKRPQGSGGLVVQESDLGLEGIRFESTPAPAHFGDGLKAEATCSGVLCHNDTL